MIPWFNGSIVVAVGIASAALGVEQGSWVALGAGWVVLFEAIDHERRRPTPPPSRKDYRGRD